jgi:hypothetical protein
MGWKNSCLIVKQYAWVLDKVLINGLTFWRITR